ncbi:hypothetical protein QO198_18570 [Pseudoalteromonas distincta]|uniref:hypothetical protein n=1 Tax=Pseudoalteromonas distincta TaxID=77608 RepID=UPI00352C537F
MIHNTICPYCRHALEIKTENRPRSRSVEHLIPNTSLSKRRGKGEGDFYSCRKCNSAKSKLDDIVGLLTKAQSDNESFAYKSLEKTILKKKSIPYRYETMINSAKYEDDGVHVNLPLDASELIKYANYLGKGMYFIKNGKAFNSYRFVMVIKIFTKGFHNQFKDLYNDEQNSDPIKDLETNPNSNVVAEDECVIWSQKMSYLIIFHHYFSFSIKIKKRNKLNEEASNNSMKDVHNSMSYKQ